MALRFTALRPRRTRSDVHVGLDLSAGRIKLVAVAAGDDGPEIVFAADHHQALPRGERPRFDAQGTGSAVARLLRGGAVRPRQIALSLGPAEGVARRLSIVNQDRDAALAALAVQLAPALGPEVVAPRVDYAPRDHPTGPRLPVFAAGARSEAVEAQQRAVAAAGGTQGPVTVAAAALVNAWRAFAPSAAADRVVLVHVGESAALWVVLHAGEPVALDAPLVGVASARDKMVGRGAADPSGGFDAAVVSEWTARVRQEVMRGIQNARREAGDGAETEYEVWISGGGARVPGFLDGLRTALGPRVMVFDPLAHTAAGAAGEAAYGPALAPALGAALQSLAAGEPALAADLISLDLQLPRSERRERVGRIPASAAARELLHDRAFRVLAAGVAAACAAAVWGGSSLEGLEARITEREQRVVRDSARVASALSRKEALDARRAAMGARIESVRTLEAGHYAWPRLLHAVAGSIPAAAWVTDIVSEDGSAEGSGPRFRVRGYSASAEVAQGFARRLVSSGGAVSAEVTRTGTVKIGRFPVAQFEVAGEYGPDARMAEVAP